jgi:aminobenzoyl-glutamate transport protein
VAEAAVDAPPEQPERKSLMQRLLDGVERVGNKVPHPAVMFVALCVLVALLSAVLALTHTHVTTEVATPTIQAPPPSDDLNYPYYPGGSIYPDLPPVPNYPPSADSYDLHTETIAVKNLLNADGIRFIFTSFVQNFNDFSAVGVIIVAMIGVGLAEEAGLIGALIRKIVKIAPPASLTFIIVLAGMISSVASDAGYLVLIPLGAVVYRSIGRNPIGGIAVALPRSGPASVSTSSSPRWTESSPRSPTNPSSSSTRRRRSRSRTTCTGASRRRSSSPS